MFWLLVFLLIAVIVVLFLLANVYLLIELCLWYRRGWAYGWGRIFLGAWTLLFVSVMIAAGGYMGAGILLLLAGLVSLTGAVFKYIRARVELGIIARKNMVVIASVEEQGTWPPPPNNPVS